MKPNQQGHQGHQSMSLHLPRDDVTGSTLALEGGPGDYPVAKDTAGASE